MYLAGVGLHDHTRNEGFSNLSACLSEDMSIRSSQKIRTPLFFFKYKDFKCKWICFTDDRSSELKRRSQINTGMDNSQTTLKLEEP